MCAMYMLCKTGMVCLGVADPHFISDCICVNTFRSHMRHILPENLALYLKKLLILCPIPLIHPLLSGDDM